MSRQWPKVGGLTICKNHRAGYHLGNHGFMQSYRMGIWFIIYHVHIYSNGLAYRPGLLQSLIVKHPE